MAKIDIMQHKGLEVKVFRGFECNNCLGCEHLEDTGFSWICTKTGEKLEGFDSMQDKLHNNMETFFPKHMGIGVGFQCPLPRVVGKITHIDLEEKEMCIEDAIEECCECGGCGKFIPERCCMNNSKECTGCWEC